MVAADSLSRLLRRARNSLWRWRGAQSLWYGLCASALVALAAGLVHLVYLPVAPLLWLSGLVAGPLIAACYALLRQRPELAAAAAALDNSGDYADFFASAWEAQNTPPARRLAGAAVLLGQAVQTSPGVALPDDWSRQPLWYDRFTFLPWAIALTGLFLLQLPGARVESVTAVSAIATAGFTPREREGGEPGGGNRKGPGVGVPSQGVPQALSSPRIREGEAPPDHAVLLGEQLGEELLRQEEPDPRAAAGPRQGVAPPVATGQRRATAGGDAAAAGGDSTAGDSLPGGESEGLSLAVKFVDIARAGAADAGTAIAGRDSAELESQGALRAGGGATASPGGIPRSSSIPYNRRFSPRQRLQISNYFEQIEELP